MKKKMLLIVLTGQGDIDVRLVPYAALQWIESPTPSSGAKYEAIPAEVMAGYEHKYHNKKAYVSAGSGDNDRALHLHGEEFYSTVEAMAYANDNDIEVVDEWHGCIY